MVTNLIYLSEFYYIEDISHFKLYIVEKPFVLHSI